MTPSETAAAAGAGREIISVAEMRAIDARSAELGVPTRLLMERAGAAVAKEIAARWSRRRVVVLCGPGANGGDGYVAARHLAEAGWDVTVGVLGDTGALTGDAAAARAAWKGPSLPASPALIARGDLVVDALFGAGLSRPLDGVAAELAVATGFDVVSVDVPSGAPGDGGDPSGPVFTASVTVTFVRKKRAHVLAPWRALCGDIVVADIGAPEATVTDLNIKLWENGPGLWALPWPGVDAHKHARGSVYVLSGPAGKTGAARLAARAALRAGAGLSTVLSPADAMAENAAHLTAIMLERCPNPDGLAEFGARAGAFVMGPAGGVGEGLLDLSVACAKLGRPLVLDADALTSGAAARDKLFGALGDHVALTPHLGEFRRLFPEIVAQGGSRIDMARTAAAQSHAVVLLKGPDTIIASPDGRVAVNTSGTPFLATAGSGDVLAGMIAGMAAQGLGVFDAACAGAWLHGRLGENLGPGLIAEDLPEALPALLNELAPARLRRRPD